MGHRVRMSDSFQGTARGMGFRHWHDVASGFHPDRVAPGRTPAPPPCSPSAGVAPEAAGEALDAIGRRVVTWN
ncbi:MAG: hypothetical protein JWN21_574 [Sphingomonas bacterium]|uniref:hypothetical protein n=1 Tax=Sphingomonas bacterium TaxID=1895847 RepID=UPI0026292D41|nr:hypothetical protein [Sphingomonas bacterium]MDB5695031.1 hypothetical protein [Sphingomonas bacterium]